MQVLAPEQNAPLVLVSSRGSSFGARPSAIIRRLALDTLTPSRFAPARLLPRRALKARPARGVLSGESER
jgi:hypothetical protein